jgi:hypothetical protein
MPKAPRTAHGLAQRLQEHLILGKNHQLDDVAGGTEAQGIDGILMIGG